MHNLNNQHMHAVNRILAYLKSSLGKGVMFSQHNHLDIVGYTGFKLNIKSSFGYVSFVGCNIQTWSKK
jgi:hypothetical protein